MADQVQLKSHHRDVPKRSATQRITFAGYGGILAANADRVAEAAEAAGTRRKPPHWILGTEAADQFADVSAKVMQF